MTATLKPLRHLGPLAPTSRRQAQELLCPATSVGAAQIVESSTTASEVTVCQGLSQVIKDNNGNKFKVKLS